MEKLRYYIAGVCLVIFTSAYSQSKAIEELGVSQQEYNDILKHQQLQKEVKIAKSFILAIDKKDLWTPIFFTIPERNKDDNCLVEPVIIPMINYGKDEE